MSSWHDREASDPEFAALMAEAHAELARSVHVWCKWNLCRNDMDPVTNKILGGTGPILCPCDHLPGWRSVRVEGQAKPRVLVKAGGRHGSRVQRSKRRHRLPDYSASFGAWIPARSFREVSK